MMYRKKRIPPTAKQANEMIQHSVEVHSAYKLSITSLQNQLFLSVSIIDKDADPEKTTEEIYNRAADILSASSSQILHERCFAKVEFHKQIQEARARALGMHQIPVNTPVTFVEGESCSENSIAGFQIRALHPDPGTSIRTIIDDGIPRGRAWNINGSTFYILQSIDGGTTNGAGQLDRKVQSEAMFRQAERLLRAQGSAFQDVVRTWIYISDILDWYDDFNVVRNHCYSEYGFINTPDSQKPAEQIYLPASTGIEGKNPFGRAATMDLFAVHRSPASAVNVRPIHSPKQLSPFRYGSAFSRAVVIEDAESKLIFVSGTASIDEDGKSVFIGDPAQQMKQTFHVISDLIAPEGAQLQDLCEATVFLKRRQDFSLSQKIMAQVGISHAPSINVVADVCRDELLFEVDAVFILEKHTV
jgi:enamine deaminase RidA (YjgF/YER057c/UK114 family)